MESRGSETRALLEGSFGFPCSALGCSSIASTAPLAKGDSSSAAMATAISLISLHFTQILFTSEFYERGRQKQQLKEAHYAITFISTTPSVHWLEKFSLFYFILFILYFNYISKCEKYNSAKKRNPRKSNNTDAFVMYT